MKKLMTLMVLLTMAESALCAASTHLSIDNRKGTRVAKATERICFSPEWISEPSLYMTATVRANGTVLKSATEPGVFEWKPRQPGTYVLTHTVTVSSFDQQAGETLSATFEVRPDCVIHFHANGGVFTGKGSDVTTFDQPFFYGESQKLMTDELKPMWMDGNGNQFLGWVRGTPEISSSEELISEDYVKTFEKGDATEETFYAVWAQPKLELQPLDADWKVGSITLRCEDEDTSGNEHQYSLCYYDKDDSKWYGIDGAQLK